MYVAGVKRRFTVKLGETIYAGALVALNASGELVNFTAATGLVCVGVAESTVENAVSGSVLNTGSGIFCFKNSAGADEITLTEIGATVYGVDNETVALTDGSSSRSAVGKVWNVDSDGVWVDTRSI
jgi:hypothetical protein